MLMTIAASCLLLITSAAAAAADPSVASAADGSLGLPGSTWGDLTSKLSPNATLISVSHADYVKDCFPEFVEYSGMARSYYVLNEKPSGVCLPHLFYGWDEGYPRPSTNGHANETYSRVVQDVLNATNADSSGTTIPESFDPANPNSFLNDDSNPSLNLPPMVLFPVVASDVIAAIQFAEANNVEISVKNSGHSFSGASQKKDTLLLNMHRYTQYSTTPTGIVDCVASMLDGSAADDLSTQPCALSLAKDKSAYVRVGGGENWEKVYFAVRDANKALEQGGGEYKYHVVGGSAGSVSPLGWTFQGGLSGNTGGRRHGFGVDQVLHIEMVLPNGHHVRFGPTKWADARAEGYTVPRTIDVSGLCRSNPEEQDEEKWEWDSCPDDFGIDFNDLWYAVRGGGGGSWGVVTSLYLQLHEYTRFETYQVNPHPAVQQSPECEPLLPTLGPLFAEFQHFYVMLPSLLDVSEEHSNACGFPGSGSPFSCYGDEDVDQAWARFLVMNNVTDLPEGNCLLKRVSPSLADSWLADGELFKEIFPRIEGRASSIPTASFVGNTGAAYNPANVLVPSAWIEESEENLQTLLSMSGDPYLAFGGGARTASDQANSLSSAHRAAGGMFGFDDELDYFWSELFPKMFDISDKSVFPPVLGGNHVGMLSSGPRKDDWTKACPPEWTLAERAEKCISVQEAIYGTTTLKRLEAIKEAVDPNYMFDCNNCIGNNRPKTKKPVEEEDNSGVEGEGAPVQSTGENSGALLIIGKSLSLMVVVVGWIGSQFMF